tara:strand:+ start:445 stop:1074 length:630 start_codon:yes stop_codon:yes gene_type:complete
MTENFNHIILSVILLFFFSIFLRISLSILNQRWAITFSHTATIVLLPLITYVITSVISGNIALSLGMVGALSIIRFRNPVRSPFELAIYFTCVTMGIAASVSLFWLTFFFISLSLFLGLLVLIDKFIVKILKKKSLFLESFSDAIEFSTLEIISSEKLKSLEENKLLISEILQDNNYHYVLSCDDIEKLKLIKNNIESYKEIKYINLKK